MYKYHDSEYGEVNVLSEEEFQLLFYPKHENCNADSETIIEGSDLHIERILCYDHKQDWFLRVGEKK